MGNVEVEQSVPTRGADRGRSEGSGGEKFQHASDFTQILYYFFIFFLK